MREIQYLILNLNIFYKVLLFEQNEIFNSYRLITGALKASMGILRLDMTELLMKIYLDSSLARVVFKHYSANQLNKNHLRWLLTIHICRFYAIESKAEGWFRDLYGIEAACFICRPFDQA